MFDVDFPKADPVPRGCGERESGGVYAESGLSPWGRPLEEFLFDPPLPIPEGLDLVNKPQLWQRVGAEGEAALDQDSLPIYDLLVWVGAEHYPYCCDYLEETRRWGASRRLNPNLDLSLLSQSSRMILAHPLVINTRWQEQRPPRSCTKKIPGHDRYVAAAEHAVKGAASEMETETYPDLSSHAAPERTPLLLPARPTTPPQSGPCLFKLWELIPREAGRVVVEALEDDDLARHPGEEALPLCLREIGSTIYHYRPTGEPVEGLMPGLFAALPITAFALIRDRDGSVNERAKARIQPGIEARGERALPFYETDH